MAEIYIPDQYALDDLDIEGEFDIEGDFDVGAEYDEDALLELMEDDNDIAGDYYVSGDDEMGFLGLPNFGKLFRKKRGRTARRLPARVVRRSAPSRLIRRAPVRVPSPLASSPVPRGVRSISRRAPAADGYSMLPLDTLVNVAGGASASIDAKCQQDFKPMSIVFDPVVAPDFVVTSIKCGNSEQVVGSGQMPAANFSPENAQNQLNLPTIPAALSLVITVTNISGAPRRLRGTASGYKFS